MSSNPVNPSVLCTLFNVPCVRACVLLPTPSLKSKSVFPYSLSLTNFFFVYHVVNNIKKKKPVLWYTVLLEFTPLSWPDTPRVWITALVTSSRATSTTIAGTQCSLTTTGTWWTPTGLQDTLSRRRTCRKIWWVTARYLFYVIFVYPVVSLFFTCQFLGWLINS